MKKFTLKLILLLCALLAGVGSTRADDVWVRRTLNKINTDDIVIIVDVNTGNAIANNPAEGKAPGAVAVTFNEDRNRIISKADDLAKVQWKVTVDNATIKFTKTPKESESNADSLLCVANDKSELRVNTSSDNSNNAFDISKGFMHIKTTGDSPKDYYVGVSSSFMSTSWALKENSNDVKDTEIAFFVKSSKPDISMAFFCGEGEQKAQYRNFEADYKGGTGTFSKPTLEVTPTQSVTYSSDSTAVAEVDANGTVTLKKRGTVKITASFAGNDTYNEYYTSYTLRVDDSTLPGGRTKPFTVEQAMSLAQNNSITVDNQLVTLEAGCCYFIKGIVSKVSNPLSDMLGGIEIPGMEDLDFSQLNIPGMSSSGGTSYYISSNGLTDNQLKVLNGNKQTTSSNVTGEVEFIGLTSNGIGVGDVVLVYGPLVYTEDKSMIPGGGGNNNNEPSKSAKVDEVNYIPSNQMIRRLTKGTVTEMKDNTGKKLADFYILNTNEFLGFTLSETPQISMKSSDEEIAKWEKDSENANSDSTFVAKGSGTVTITVSAKVMVNTGNNEEKSYTMKCKYDIEVVSRDLEPLGKNNGDYVLVTDASSLQADDRLLLVGDSNDKHYVMGNADARMGGKEAKEVTISNDNNTNKIKSTDVPDGALEVTLEQNGDYWRFIAGKSGNDNLYLYISDPESSGSGGYDISSLTGSGAKIKTGTLTAVGDSCNLTITNVVNNNNETTDSVKIKYNFTRVKDNKDEAKNVMKFNNSSYSTSFGGYEDSENAKGSMLHIYRFVPNNVITIGFDPVSQWRTLVCDRNVTLGEGLKAYIANEIEEDKVKLVETSSTLKAGEPYLLHGTKGWGDYELTITENDATPPTNNLLKISNHETTNDVYVLAKDENKVGFYKWSGGLLGAGRVYLDIPSTTRLFVSFDIESEATGITELSSETSADKQYFTLDGRQIENPQKGLYIVNGKKTVIK